MRWRAPLPRRGPAWWRSNQQLAEALPGNVKGVVIDVSDSEAVTRCCEQLLDEGLGPDVLVNVAGVLATGRLDEVDDALLLRTFAINTFAPFYLMRALTPGFRGGAGAPSSMSPPMPVGCREWVWASMAPPRRR